MCLQTPCLGKAERAGWEDRARSSRRAPPMMRRPPPALRATAFPSRDGHGPAAGGTKRWWVLHDLTGCCTGARACSTTQLDRVGEKREARLLLLFLLSFSRQRVGTRPVKADRVEQRLAARRQRAAAARDTLHAAPVEEVAAAWRGACVEGRGSRSVWSRGVGGMAAQLRCRHAPHPPTTRTEAPPLTSRRPSPSASGSRGPAAP